MGLSASERDDEEHSACCIYEPRCSTAGQEDEGGPPSTLAGDDLCVIYGIGTHREPRMYGALSCRTVIPSSWRNSFVCASVSAELDVVSKVSCIHGTWEDREGAQKGTTFKDRGALC